LYIRLLKNLPFKKKYETELKMKGYTLFHDTFKAFFNIKSGQIVLCHIGSYGGLTDLIFNNTRNFMVTKFKYLITYRNEIAKKGHANLEEYFNQCLANNDETIHSSNMNDENMNNSFIKINTNPEEFKKYNNNIKKYIKLHLSNSNDNVKEYLKHNLTTIGHSQGAIYAYLYGNTGKEVITFNPAPFNSNDKPENTYDIRIKGDIVSKMSGLSVIGKTQKANKLVLNPTKNKKNVKIK
jgi:hypothetical protein